MFETMLEVKFDSEFKRYMITPLNRKGNRDYIIMMNSEYEAKFLCTQISMGIILSPDSGPLSYKSVGLHSNGHTLLFEFKNKNIKKT